MSKCLYAILEIDKSASTDDIKKAYRKMSLKWHPDRNGGSAEATTKFQDITMAYETLSDEEKKRRYDMGGGLGNMQNMNHNMNHSDILNFFTKSMFGGGMSGMPGIPGIHVNMDGFSAMNMNGLPPGVHMFTMDGIRQGMNKPVPIIKNEEITIGKAYTGCTVPIDITRWVLENGIKREEIETLYFPIPEFKESILSKIDILKKLSSGTGLREGLDNIVSGGMGAIIVISNPYTDNVFQGGFKINCKFLIVNSLLLQSKKPKELNWQLNNQLKIPNIFGNGQLN